MCHKTSDGWGPPPILPAELVVAAARLKTTPRRIIERDDGSTSIVMETEWSDTSSQSYTTGWHKTLSAAIKWNTELFQTLTMEELKMNLLSSTKLFPNIRGVMLKTPRTLTMSGRVNITESKDQGDARVEIWFTDTDKSAIINRTQALNIIDVYGPETNAWKGKPVVLFGEEGNWFGKHTWGIRVDLDATRRASKTVKRTEPAANGATA